MVTAARAVVGSNTTTTTAAVATALSPLPANVQRARWPDDCPHHEAAYFLTVVCGNSHVHWALHDGTAESKYEPTLFWRTSVPANWKKVYEKADPTELIGLYLPDRVPQAGKPQPKELLFGGEVCNVTAATYTNAMRRVPVWNIYILSTNRDKLEFVSWLFSQMPMTRLLLLETSDFIPKAYSGMGSDRAAAAVGAGAVRGVPVLVVDGGTALTYTALDRHGQLVGGGIGVGLAAKFQALAHYTGALPLIFPNELENMMDSCIRNAAPLAAFATDTKTAMVQAVLRETAAGLESVVRSWVNELAKDDKEAASAAKNDDAIECPFESNTGKIPCVCVTGGDSVQLTSLMQADHGHVLDVPTKSALWQQVQVLREKHLIPLGVSFTLLRHVVLPDQRTERRALQAVLVGQRVARRDKMTASQRIARGTIVAIQPEASSQDGTAGCDDNAAASSIDGDIFVVHFDDEDRCIMKPTQVYDGLNLYSVRGEYIDEEGSDVLVSKKEDAAQAAELLAKASASVQALEERRKQVAAAALPPPSSSAKKRKVTNDVADGGGPTKIPPLPPRDLEGDVFVDAQMSDAPTIDAAAATENKKNTDDNADDDRVSAPHEWVGRRVAKYFDGYDDIFFGTITRYYPSPAANDVASWWVHYDDDDQEDLYEDECTAAFDLYEQHQANDDGPPVRG